MIEKIEKEAENFKKFLSEVRRIKVFSHLDTDGVSSAAILSKALLREDKQFQLTILKQLDEDLIEKLKEESKKFDLIFFLDFGSTKLSTLSKFSCKVVVLDHHEIKRSELAESKESAENILFINPLSYGKEISASCLTYFFVKALNKKNQDLAQIAVLGMIGDSLERKLSKESTSLIEDASKQGMVIRKGPIIFSSTRPLKRSLEFSSSIFIPGVTGSTKGTLALLRESGISDKKTLIDLTKEETSRLVTSILLKRVHNNYDQDIVGNIYLIKFFNQLEDARELSTLVNACGRLSHADLALAMLMGSVKAKREAESIYDRYKHELIRALNWFNSSEKIEKKGYVIANAKNKVRDTMIGTIISIVSSSSVYPRGTIMIGMAYRDDKIKVSARISGYGTNSNFNLYYLLNSVTKITGGESGGHARAAGSLVPIEKEKLFIEALEKELKTEEIRIKI